MLLIGEDGTTLKEKTWSDTSTVGWRMNINEKIEFTPRVAAEIRPVAAVYLRRKQTVDRPGI